MYAYVFVIRGVLFPIRGIDSLISTDGGSSHHSPVGAMDPVWDQTLNFMCSNLRGHMFGFVLRPALNLNFMCFEPFNCSSFSG